MKALMLVLACMVIGSSCVVSETPDPEDGPLFQLEEPCLSGKGSYIASVGGISLIRAPRFWLLDLGDRTVFDVAAVIAAAKRCDAHKGCGAAMTPSQIQAIIDGTAQAQVEQLPVRGALAVAYRFGKLRNVVQVWGDARELRQAAPQLSPLPKIGCLGCGLCTQGQCEGPPPIPSRLYFFDFTPIHFQ